MKFIKCCLIYAVAGLFAIACSQTAKTPTASNTVVNTNKPAETTPAQPASPVDEVADAKKLYATNCMTCHKDSGKGGKVTIEGKTIEPDDLTSAKMKAKSEDKLVTYILDGAPDDGMPAFKGKLTDDQIKSVVKYIRSL